MINPNQKFMFASYSFGCGSIVLATMDTEDLHPSRLGAAVNRFARDFRVNLRSVLLKQLEVNGRFTDANTLYVRLDVDHFVETLKFSVDFGENIDIDSVIQKVGEELRVQLPFYAIFTPTFRLQGGEIL